MLEFRCVEVYKWQVLLTFESVLDMKLSPEEENFVKITKIVLDVLPKYLRKCFVEQWNKKYPNYKWQCGSASGNFLFDQLPSSTKNDWRNKGNIENLKNGNEQNWDTTTLVFALLYSGLGLTEPCRPNNQREEPLRISEAIDVIRITRNVYFAHAKSMSCPPDVFTRVMKDIKHAAKCLFDNAGREIEEIVEEGNARFSLYDKASQFFAGFVRAVGSVAGTYSAPAVDPALTTGLTDPVAFASASSYEGAAAIAHVIGAIGDDLRAGSATAGDDARREIDEIDISKIEVKLTEHQLEQVKYEERRQEELESLFNN